MGKIPKQRKPGQTGGGNHRASKFTSVARGGRPSAGRHRTGGGGCAVVALAALGGVGAGMVTLWSTASWWL